MGLFGRRHALVVAPLLAVLACGSDDGPSASPPPGSPDGSIPDGGGEKDAGEPVDDDVYVTVVERRGFSTGATTDVRQPAESLGMVRAIATVNGSTQAFAGAAQPDGSIKIVGVPRGPYILENRLRLEGSRPTDPPLVRQYPIDGARKVRLGPNTWGRSDTTAMTSATKLALSVTTPAKFVEGDTFGWIGIRSFFLREATYALDGFGQANIPAVGASSSGAWTIDADGLAANYGPAASGLPSNGDDLKITQTRAVKITGQVADRFNPWAYFTRSTAVAALDVTAPSFTKDTTNTVSGTMTAPVTESIALTFAGSTFATIRGEAGYPKDTRSNATITVTQEAGPGPEIFSSVAPSSWEIAASSTPKPLDPSCFPATFPVRCSASQCATSCAAATDGRNDPGDFTYTFDAPRLYTSGMRDIVGAGYSFSWDMTHPERGQITLSASSATSRRATGKEHTFALALGPVQKLRIRDASLAWDGSATISAASKPTITFEAPKLGVPDYYDIRIIELRPDGSAGRPSLEVARLLTQETSVPIPDDVLRAGHYYYLRVTARRQHIEWSEPDTRKEEGYDATGIFSPPFACAP